MFAVDIKVSPLIPASILLSTLSALLLLFEGVRGSNTWLCLLLAFLLCAHAAAVLKSSYSQRVRRVVFTPTRSILIYESADKPPVHALPPEVKRSGEFLVVLSFSLRDSIQARRSAAAEAVMTLRFWPGSLERAQASRLRRHLRFLEADHTGG